MDDPVRRGGEGDRDAEGEDGGEGERGLAPQRADGEEHVLPEVVHPEGSAVFAHTLLILGATEPPRVVDVTELHECDLARAVRRVSLALELARAHGEVELELVVHVRLVGSGEPEAEQRAEALRRHVRLAPGPCVPPPRTASTRSSRRAARRDRLE